MDEVWLVICNCPDQASAEAIAASLIESNTAACVNIMPACTSIYRWKGAVERASEVPLLIKTTAQGYPALEALIRANHPYEVPEIIAVSAAAGLPAYLDWVRNEIRQ